MLSNNISQKGSGFSDKIEIIQVLRGIAVMMVVIFHLKAIMNPGDFLRKELDFLFNAGAAGVDIFFVISGFIMVYVTRKLSGGFSSSKTFLLKRVLRIWPLYIIATLAYALIVARHTFNFEIFSEIVKSLLFIPVSYTEPPYFGYAYLGIGWSLNYEMYFYFLIAISLLSEKLRWYIFALLIAITLILVPVIYAQLTPHPLQTENYGSLLINLITNPIIWEFVYGVIIGLLYTNPISRRLIESFFHIKIITITVVVLVVWQYLSGFYANHGPLNWGMGMALLFLALLFYNTGKCIQYPSWLVYLGNMSYSIYLWHIPVAAVIPMIFGKLALPVFSSGTPAFLLTVSITLIVSHLSYQFLEGKLHSFLIRKLKL
jgi:exopolysaccharide production protein ExoZ